MMALNIAKWKERIHVGGPRILG